MSAVIAIAGCAAASPTSPASPTSDSSAPTSNARSGPASGGAVGTVGDVSASSFTLLTTAGEKVTVTWASASDLTTGDPVLVLGTTSGTTIAATQVVAQPTAAEGSTMYSASAVVPFTQGSPSAAQADGQIPADYTEGDGTIVSGSDADSATEAALAAYPGGVVDRVVQLSTGEYEVHNIGVNWPHHVFVDAGFTVVGAN